MGKEGVDKMGPRKVGMVCRRKKSFISDGGSDE